MRDCPPLAMTEYCTGTCTGTGTGIGALIPWYTTIVLHVLPIAVPNGRNDRVTRSLLVSDFS